MSARAHLVVLAITIVALVSIIRLVRRRQLRAKYSLLWLSIGSVLIVLGASPRLLDRVSASLGIYYAPATFFLGAIAFLLLIVVHFSWELSRLEERLRIVAEELALLRSGAPPDDARNDAAD
ncbi:MAG TPA: DUF2304 domain-containing protein [Acidimicrobiales bacterium]|jgi:hypothetical protein|nr:DUF2304 domain-containing protein [Acidimicrobiales bacterium]